MFFTCYLLSGRAERGLVCRSVLASPNSGRCPERCVASRLCNLPEVAGGVVDGARDARRKWGLSSLRMPRRFFRPSSGTASLAC